MGLAIGHQVDVTHRVAGVGRQVRVPHQAGGAGSQQVGHLHGSQVVGGQRQGHEAAVAEAVAAAVQIELGAPAAQVDQVGGAAAVDVRQAQPRRIELVRCVEAGRIGQAHLPPEPPIAQVGPVAHRAVADPHQIGEPVAAHVGKKECLAAVVEHQPRASLFVSGLALAQCWGEAALLEGGIPGEHLLLADQRIGMAVAGEVHEAQVRVLPVDAGQAAEGHMARPAPLRGALLEAGGGAAELHQLDRPVAG